MERKHTNTFTAHSHYPHHPSVATTMKSSYRSNAGFSEFNMDESTFVHQLNTSALLSGFSLSSITPTNENIQQAIFGCPKEAATLPRIPVKSNHDAYSDSRRGVRFKPSDTNLRGDISENEEQITPAVLLNIHRRDSRSSNFDQENSGCVSPSLENEDFVDGPLRTTNIQMAERSKTGHKEPVSSCDAIRSSSSKDAKNRRQSAASITSAASIKSVHH